MYKLSELGARLITGAKNTITEGVNWKHLIIEILFFIFIVLAAIHFFDNYLKGKLQVSEAATTDQILAVNKSIQAGLQKESLLIGSLSSENSALSKTIIINKTIYAHDQDMKNSSVSDLVNAWNTSR